MHFDDFIRKACASRNLDWRKYRRASQRRVLERIRQLGLGGYQDYLSYLERHPDEAGQLPNLLRVTLSRFFRERACWEELAGEALPELLAGKADPVLRVLSLGCCGGEEPYTLALLWKEELEPKFSEYRLEILAVDLDQACLARAGQGLYQSKTLREVPEGIKRRWFEKEPGGWRLDPVIRRLVAFSQLDLLEDSWPRGWDLIICRYLFFTYFTGERQLERLQRIQQALHVPGLLMIGRKESIDLDASSEFEQVCQSGCLFKQCFNSYE